jgi:hypothetical protein
VRKGPGHERRAVESKSVLMVTHCLWACVRACVHVHHQCSGLVARDSVVRKGPGHERRAVESKRAENRCVTCSVSFHEVREG